jgi:hypothetical protein
VHVEGSASKTYEVDTDGGDVALGVGVVCEPEKQARLSDTGVADEEELEKVVVSGRRASARLGGGSMPKETARQTVRGTLGNTVSQTLRARRGLRRGVGHERR